MVQKTHGTKKLRSTRAKRAAMRLPAAWLLGLTTIFATVPALPAAMPVEGQLLQPYSKIRVPCFTTDNAKHGELQYWELYTIDPERIHGGSGGVDLLNRDKDGKIPTVETFKPRTDFGPWLVVEGWGFPEKEAGCLVGAPVEADSWPEGLDLELRRPGPYMLEVYHAYVNWELIAEDAEYPEPAPCGQNDPAYPDPLAPNGPPESTPDGYKWALIDFCNETKVTRFNVAGEATRCDLVGDMSAWPGYPYINQYAAGARRGLPFGFCGKRGGNACGPSSVLMAMLRSTLTAQQVANRVGEPLGLDSLKTVYERTMTLPPADYIRNQLSWTRALAYIQSKGWWTARFEKLKAYFPDDVYFISPERIFGDLESSGPLVMSTALGNSTWGKTGGGHVIEIESADLSDFHVNDPAGDYFKGPTAHYNSKSCGATARYPHGWMFAMTAGRHYISMGPRTLPWKKPSARAVLQTVYGSAVAVYDTVPDGADLATSFYLENTTGQRAGWVAGEIAEEIPNASVAQPTPEWTNPSAGDPDVDPAPEPAPPTPRMIVLSNPEPGTVLHVVGGASGTWAVTVDAWGDGNVLATDKLSGTTRIGEDQLVESAALGTAIALAGGGAPTTTSTTTLPSGTTTTTIIGGTTTTIAGVTTTTFPSAVKCSQPVSTGADPLASDCLFILRAAVGSSACAPACICDVNGVGGATAADALTCLKKVVGQAVALACPCD